MTIDREFGLRARGESGGQGWRRSGIRPLLVVGAAALAALWGPNSAAGQDSDALTMSEAVRIALEQSRDVLDAELGLELASEQVSEAWASVFPQIDFSTSYTRNLKPAVNFLPAQIFDPNAAEGEFIQVQFGADNSWSASLDVDQPLFQAQAFLGVGAAGRFRGLQEETLRGRKQAVVTRVRSAYYSLLLSQEQQRLLTKSVERVRRSLAETEALNRAGLSSDYDLLRLQVELANLEPNLRRAENAVRAERRTLAVELAGDYADGVTVAGSLAGMDLSAPAANTPENQEILRFAGVEIGSGALDPVVLVATALDSRSDLRQLELTESLRRTEMRVEQFQYLPELRLFASYGANAQQNGSPDFFGDEMTRATSSFAGIRLTLPVFTGLRRDARIDQKRAALRQAELQTRLRSDQATNQVRDLVEAAEEALLRAQGQRLAVTQATRGFEIASAQYREGLGSQLELTDSEVALRQSEFNYAQAVFDYLVARAQLDEAIGQVPLVDPGVFAPMSGGS